MGFFKLLASSIIHNENPSKTRGYVCPKVPVLESGGCRSWLYAAETKRDKNGYRWAECGSSIQNAMRASACSYFQDLILKISGDTIGIRAIPPKDAILPQDWTFASNDQYALVDDNNVAISLIYKKYLQKAGYSIGQKIPCAISRPRMGKGDIELHILMTEEAIEKELKRQQRDYEIRKKRYAEETDKKISSALGLGNITGFDIVDQYIGVPSENKWLKKRNLKTPFHVSLKLEQLPTKRGSKAKPHISMIADGEEVIEIAARHKSYSVAALHIGEHAFKAALVETRYPNELEGLWRLYAAFLKK